MHISQPPPATPLFEIRPLSWLGNHCKEEWRNSYSEGEFFIVWIKEGSLLHRIEEEDYEVKNMLYCIAPGYSHLIWARQNVQGYFLRFNTLSILGWNIQGLAMNANVFRSYPIDLLYGSGEETHSEIGDIFHKLAQEFSRHTLKRYDILSSYLGVLLSYLIHHAKSLHHPSCAQGNVYVVQRFFSMLSRDFRTKKQVTDYASELAITPNYLNEIVKKATGKPVSYHIKEQVITEAKRQVYCNGTSMKETAYFLGFDDIAHFSKYFKNATGERFSDFRKSITVHPL